MVPTPLPPSHPPLLLHSSPKTLLNPGSGTCFQKEGHVIIRESTAEYDILLLHL